MWLRREDDSDDPCTWRPVRAIPIQSSGKFSDPRLQGVKLLAVSFNDETPELVLNQTDRSSSPSLRHTHLPGL